MTNLRRSIAGMTNLLDTIHTGMYACPMPDAAMDGLFDAHHAVVDELAGTKSLNQADINHKGRAISVLRTSNEEDGTWDADIAKLTESIAADKARLSEPLAA